MTDWAAFEAEAPELAAAGRRLLYQSEIGQALLATVRADAPPRLHPIWLAILDGRLCAFILPSAKRTDLERDGRYALHSLTGPSVPSEFSVRGHAHPVTDPTVRSAVAGQWYFPADDTYELFEFSVEAAVLGVRDSSDDWPPRYTSWRSASDRS